MKNRAFGLDIGGTTLKAVWMEKQKGGYQLLSAKTSPTPPKGMLSESPVDQQIMADAIRRLVHEAKISTQFVNVALPESQVYTRAVEMPMLSDKELASAIYWEAEQHIPTPLDQMTLSWEVLSRGAKTDGGKMDVLLVGAPTALVEKYEKVLSMAGLVTASVETEILSVIRSLTDPSSMPNSVIVNIGAASTPFAIIRNGIIEFTYTVPTGGSAINRAIASDFGFSLSQAEEYKKTYGVSQSVRDAKIGQTTQLVLMSIVNEIKKAMAFYQSKFATEEPLRQMILSGGTANLPGIDVFFTQSVGIETVIANPWRVIVGQELSAELQESAPEYTIAVGLAMREDE